MAAAALATAVTAVLVPSAATTAAPPIIVELRTELEAAMAAERRALELLAKKPPRDGAAVLQLDRSRGHLGRVTKGLKGLSYPPYVAGSIQRASELDDLASDRLREAASHPNGREVAIDEIERALFEKTQVRSALVSAPPGVAPQCADGRDNDGDQLVDARVESGCTSSKDASEGSALTCTLRSGTNQVTGSCSGTFAKLELVAPQGVAFDTRQMPVAAQSEVCRYSSPQRLECLMSDGEANPRHVVNVRFKLKRGTASGLRALIRDFAGRGRTWPVASAQASSAAPYLRFSLSYTHVGLSHVCASVEAASGALLKLSLEGPNGQASSGTLQLKKKAAKTATGGFSFRILEFGSYRVAVTATVGGKSVTKTQTIAVTDAPGDSRCSATGAPPP